MSNINGSRLRHGHRRKGKTTSEYSVWMKMRSRCNNERCPAYKDYGARGIKVCARWDVFELFMLDMGPRPAGLSLDRIDNDKGYEPSNCRWATMKQQQRNRRDNRIITFAGVSASLAEHCERLGLSYKTVHQRLSSGFTTDDALSRQRYQRAPALNVTLSRLA
jgi:hypothetical protein